MPHLTKTLIVSVLTVVMTACATTPETPTNTTSPLDSSSTPVPQETGAEGSVTAPNTQDKQFAQEIQVSEPLTTIRTGQTVKIPVTVENTSDFTWSPTGSSPVNLSYYWLDSTGTRVPLNGGERTPLTKDLSPQGSTKLSATVKAPDNPGNYKLLMTMVQENVAWFSDAGAKAPTISVNVTSN